MNREHPNWHRAKIAHYECGWEGGDRGGLAERENGRSVWKEQ